MTNITLLLYISIGITLILLLVIFKGKSRILFGSILVGLTICLISGEIDGYILEKTAIDEYTMTICFTPIVEEILKAIPIIYFVMVFKPSKQLALECAMALGIGFAILENSAIVASCEEIATISWALIRGFGAGLMHGLCTFAVALGLTLVVDQRRAKRTSTFALLALAIIFHSMFNVLIQSNYMILGFIVPLVTYVVTILITIYLDKKGKQNEQKK